jgi:hypothetical protein
MLNNIFVSQPQNLKTHTMKKILTAIFFSLLGAFTAIAQTCTPSVSAPVINTSANYSSVNSAFSIPCGSATANLSTLTTSPAAPAGTNLTWHTGTPATDANRILTTTAVAGTVKVYAAFRSSTGCYSSTKEITVYVPICVQDDDLTAFPILKGQPITLPSIFTNDSFNGSAFTLANPNVRFVGDLWTPANATVNDDGTITVPAYNTFVVGTTPVYYYKICDKDPDATVDSSCKTGYVKFKIVCASGTTAPPVNSNLSNICPATTVNLNNAHTGTVPNTTELIWYTNNSHSGPQLTATQVAAAGAGTYYAYYFSAEGGCFSPASNPVVVSIGNCSGCSVVTANLQPYNNTSVAPYTGAPTSQSVFANNQIKIGSNRLYLTHTTTLDPALFSPNRISDVHYTGETGIHIGHSKNVATGISYAERIVSTLQFDAPMKRLSFTLSDVDLGDNIIVNAYDASNNLINISPSNYTIYNPANISRNGNRFYPTNVGFESLSNTREGTVDFNFNGLSVSKIVFEFYDTEYTGSYTISKISGEECVSYCTKPANLQTVSNPTKIGITVQQRKAGWPESIPNGFIAMESKEKGFVITRVQNSTLIADPKPGMLIYDKDAQCVKLYNGTIWKCLSRSCNDTL